MYYHSDQSYVWLVLNAIEFVWGIQFLRDSGKINITQAIILCQAMLFSGTSTIAIALGRNVPDLLLDSSAAIGVVL